MALGDSWFGKLGKFCAIGVDMLLDVDGCTFVEELLLENVNFSMNFFSIIFILK
jgi:hypothetical protein